MGQHLSPMDGVSEPPSQETRRALDRRLEGYWKMEGGCAMAFPPLALLLARPADRWEWAALGLALLACCALLVIGSLYWRAALLRLRRNSLPMRTALRLAEHAQAPLLALSLLSIIPPALLWMLRGPHPAVVAAMVFGALAVLEYVNYYHVQLQNFDHAPDFSRLIQTRRLRPAHLASEIADYRRRRM
jgi:hypothetical protein